MSEDRRLAAVVVAALSLVALALLGWVIVTLLVG